MGRGQLAERGAIDLDAEVNSHLTSFRVPDGFTEPVRVWHLLSHTAGFEDRPMSLAALPEDLTDLETALVRDMPSQDWEPGRHTAYNNYGASLAAQLVAEVSGMSWEDYVDRNILQPLGMTRTSVEQPTPGNVLPGMTKVYSRDGDGEPLETSYEIAALAPGGGMVATTRDIGSFMLAHLQHGRLGEARILKEATARRMHSQLFTADPRLLGNAHGFWESEEHGQRVLSHAGDHNSNAAGLWLLPDHDLGVYVAYNSAGGSEARGELWTAFLAHAVPAGARTAPAPAAAVPADLGRLAGTSGGLRISSTTPGKLFKLINVVTISVEDDQLVTAITGAEPKRWTALGDGAFADTEGGWRMAFSDGDARPSHVSFDGPSTDFANLAAWAATPWYDRAALHGVLLAGSLLLLLSAIVLWPVLAIVRRHRERPGPAGAGAARWWAGATAGLFLLFIVLFGLALLDPAALEHGLPPLLLAALTIGIAAAVLTVGTLVHTALAWRNGYWSVAGRAHYTLVAVGFVALTWQLHHWNLLGYHA